MNDMHPPADQPDDERPDRLSVGDPVLGKTRLLARECDTCIFKPGNLMHLNPGRQRRLVAEARGDAAYIICHSTLPYAGKPDPAGDLPRLRQPLHHQATTGHRTTLGIHRGGPAAQFHGSLRLDVTALQVRTVRLDPTRPSTRRSRAHPPPVEQPRCVCPSFGR
jgi:hypothetical protein